MAKTALIYSFNTNNTKRVAEMIASEFGEKDLEVINAEDLTGEIFMKNKTAILGVPTWFDGELPNYWDEFVPALEDLKLKGYKFAIFGLGDYKEYPQNYMDAIGIMTEILENCGATVVGFTPSDGYKFESSRGIRGDQFCGLPVDNHDSKDKRIKKISSWIAQIKKEFGGK